MNQIEVCIMDEVCVVREAVPWAFLGDSNWINQVMKTNLNLIFHID